MTLRLRQIASKRRDNSPRALRPNGAAGRRPSLIAILALSIVVVGCARVNTAAQSSDGVSVLVKVGAQRLYLVRGGKVVREYPVSTSKYGIGSQAGSLKTPLGRHRIVKKIGADAPIYTIFKERVNTGALAVIDRTLKGAAHDDVTTRVMWLEGLEPGLNRGRGIDSRERFIYIHGTPSEGLIGRPASNGCVRMYNKDVVELFDQVSEGTPVLIVT